jgi:hypothetical protein
MHYESIRGSGWLTNNSAGPQVWPTGLPKGKFFKVEFYLDGKTYASTCVNSDTMSYLSGTSDLRTADFIVTKTGTSTGSTTTATTSSNAPCNYSGSVEFTVIKRPQNNYYLYFGGSKYVASLIELRNQNTTAYIEMQNRNNWVNKTVEVSEGQRLAYDDSKAYLDILDIIPGTDTDRVKMKVWDCR